MTEGELFENMVSFDIHLIVNLASLLVFVDLHFTWTRLYAMCFKEECVCIDQRDKEQRKEGWNDRLFCSSLSSLYKLFQKEDKPPLQILQKIPPLFTVN